MKFEVPAELPRFKYVTDRDTFSLTLERDLRAGFHALRAETQISANKLLNYMVRHCLQDMGKLK